MFVAAISIRKQGYYVYGGKADATKPYEATIEVQGEHGKVELRLSPDLSQRVLEIIADEVAAAGKATAEAMVASFINLPQIEQEKDGA